MLEPYKVSEESIKLGYEESDADARGIFLLALVGLLVGAAIFTGVWIAFLTFKREVERGLPVRSALPVEEKLPPEPRLELNPHEDFLALHREKTSVLNSYGWMDPKTGWVRIPIEDAMKLYEEEHKKGGPMQ